MPRTAAARGDPMPVVREALLSQLQKDRLRQEIIVAELAKIECAMALRAASGHQAKPWPFSAKQFGWEQYAGVGDEHDVKLPDKDGRKISAEFKSGKPAVVEGRVERPKPCEGQQNAAFDELKLPGSSETVPSNKVSPAVKWELTGITIPVKKPKAPMKWSCVVCQVQATSPKGLLNLI